MEYACAYAWCTDALSASIERLWSIGLPMHQDRLLTYTIRLLQSCKLLLVITANDHMIARFVKAATTELVQIASLCQSGMTSGFLTQSALRAHERNSHTTVTNFKDTNTNHTFASLATQAIGSHWQPTEEQPIRYFLDNKPLNQTTYHAHDSAVVELVDRLQAIVSPHFGAERCNVQGVFAALVVPANRYNGRIEEYLQKLVLMHSSVYVQQHTVYTHKMCEVVADLYRLLDACSNVERHRYLLVSMKQTPPVVASSEWWGVTANQQLARQIFKLCVHVHVEFTKYLGDCILVGVWPTIVSPALVTTIQDVLCTTDDRAQINDINFCLSQLRNSIDHNNTCQPVLASIDGVLDSIAELGCVSTHVLCVLLADMAVCVPQCRFYMAFKRMVFTFRTTLTHTQMGRRLCALMRLPEVFRVQHVYEGWLRTCASIAVCSKVTGVDVNVQVVRSGVIAPAEVSVVSTHITSLEKLALSLQRFVKDSD